MMTRLMVVGMLAMVAVSGCTFTAAQLSDWSGSLAGLGVGGFWDLNVTPAVNPTGDNITKGFLDLGRKIAIQLTTNSINQHIPLDPGSIK